MGIVGAACTLVVALGGCYMDATAGAGYAGGGVKGPGWELGLAFGFGWDIAATVRPSIGYGADMTHVGASDGKYGTTGMTVDARADIALSSTKFSSVRAILQYGHGSNDELHFIAMTDPTRYISHAKAHSFFVGLGKEFYTHPDQPLVKTGVSYGFGPHVTWVPNDFVGDTTTVGLQAHVGFWWVPQFSNNSHGSLLDHLADPTPITPLPTTPDPVQCHDEYGSPVSC